MPPVTVLEPNCYVVALANPNNFVILPESVNARLTRACVLQLCSRQSRRSGTAMQRMAQLWRELIALVIDAAAAN
jgi:hypothetical protein